MCRSFIGCSALVSPQEALSKLCTLEGGSTGVCCKEVTQLEGTNGIIVAPDFGLRSTNLGVLSTSVVLRALDLGQSWVNNITNIRTKSTTNKNLKSAAYQHAVFQQPSPGLFLSAVILSRPLCKEG